MILRNIILAIFSPFAISYGEGEFSLDIKLLSQDFDNGIRLKINVTNLSDKSVEVSKKRYPDYKSGAGRALGDYIIQIEKWVKTEFEPYGPSANIDWTYREEEYIKMEKGSSIVDTIVISGSVFPGKKKTRHGFPLGQYRL